MRIQNGVVMGLDGKKIIVYTEAGDFIRIPLSGKPPEIGEVIEVLDSIRKPPASFFAVAAALVIMVATGFFYLVFSPRTAAAYVALDINPSAELMVNRDGLVVKANPLNQEAKSLLAKVRVDGQDIYSAVEIIIREALKSGYIRKDNKNMVMASIVSLKGEIPTVREDKLKQIIHDELVEMQAGGEIVVSGGTGEVREQADKDGLSMNKFLIYDRARQEGIDISVDVLRDSSVREVLGQAGIHLKRIFPKECIEVFQASPQPPDIGGLDSAENGFRLGTAAEHSYSSGMGHGVEHSGATGRMGSNNSDPVAPYRSGILTDSESSKSSGQSGDTRGSKPGGMEIPTKDMGGKMSRPSGGSATESTTSIQGHSNGRM